MNLFFFIPEMPPIFEFSKIVYYFIFPKIYLVCKNQNIIVNLQTIRICIYICNSINYEDSNEQIKTYI